MKMWLDEVDVVVSKLGAANSPQLDRNITCQALRVEFKRVLVLFVFIYYNTSDLVAYDRLWALPLVDSCSADKGL